MSKQVLHFAAFTGSALADAFTLIEQHDVQVELIQGGTPMMETVRSHCAGTIMVEDGATIWGADLKTASVPQDELLVSGGDHQVRMVFDGPGQLRLPGA
jgi:hypothetical protein